MATPGQIAALVTEIKNGLINKGFVFGTFTPDFQTLFTEVYAETILTYGGGGGSSGPIEGGDIDWSTVDQTDIMNVISGEIKETDLFIDLRTTIGEIPDIRLTVDNVMSNLALEWSSLDIYGPGQIVSWLGYLWECTDAILVPTITEPPDDDDPETGHWKKVGTQTAIYNTVNNAITLVYTAQETAEGAATSTEILQTELFGEGHQDGDPALAGSVIWNQEQAIVTTNEAIATAETSMRTDFLGPDYDPLNPATSTTAGYLWDIILNSSTPGSIAESTEILQASVGNNLVSIQTEQSVRAISLGEDYRDDIAYSPNAVVVYQGTLWQNKTGTSNPIGEWIQGDWTPIEANLYAEYAIKLDVNGYVSGFGLMNDGATSAFIVNADTFAIDHPNNQGGDVIPFIVQDNKVWMDSAYIKDLTATNFVAGKIIATEINLATGVDDSTEYSNVGEIVDGLMNTDSNMLLVATQNAETVNQLPGLDNGVTNFNTRNDRIEVPPEKPLIAGQPGSVGNPGDAISFSFNPDGTTNIEFKWEYGTGTDATNIDGFIVYIKCPEEGDPVNTVYDLNIDFAGSSFFTIPFGHRAFTFMSLTSDKYYTIGVEAFRVVDEDIEADGIFRSVIAQSSESYENPVFLDLNVPAPVNVTFVEVNNV